MDAERAARRCTAAPYGYDWPTPPAGEYANTHLQALLLLVPSSIPPFGRLRVVRNRQQISPRYSFKPTAAISSFFAHQAGIICIISFPVDAGLAATNQRPMLLARIVARTSLGFSGLRGAFTAMELLRSHCRTRFSIGFSTARSAAWLRHFQTGCRGACWANRRSIAIGDPDIRLCHSRPHTRELGRRLVTGFLPDQSEHFGRFLRPCRRAGKPVIYACQRPGFEVAKTHSSTPTMI